MCESLSRPFFPSRSRAIFCDGGSTTRGSLGGCDALGSRCTVYGTRITPLTPAFATPGGVLAILLADQTFHAAPELAEGLQLLQHRGYVQTTLSTWLRDSSTHASPFPFQTGRLWNRYLRTEGKVLPVQVQRYGQGRPRPEEPWTADWIHGSRTR